MSHIYNTDANSSKQNEVLDKDKNIHHNEWRDDVNRNEKLIVHHDATLVDKNENWSRGNENVPRTNVVIVNTHNKDDLSHRNDNLQPTHVNIVHGRVNEHLPHGNDNLAHGNDNLAHHPTTHVNITDHSRDLKPDVVQQHTVLTDKSRDLKPDVITQRSVITEAVPQHAIVTGGLEVNNNRKDDWGHTGVNAVPVNNPPNSNYSYYANDHNRNFNGDLNPAVTSSKTNWVDQNVTGNVEQRPTIADDIGTTGLMGNNLGNNLRNQIVNPTGVNKNADWTGRVRNDDLPLHEKNDHLFIKDNHHSAETDNRL